MNVAKHIFYIVQYCGRSTCLITDKKLAAPDGASDATPYKYDTLRKTWFTQPLAVANVESSQNYLAAVPI